MVKIVKLFLICAVALTATSLVTAEYPYKWIEQKVDHFNKSDTRTWQMQYYYNDVFVDSEYPRGPLFIHIGGRNQESFDLSDSLFGSTALSNRAYFFETQHRYFEDSIPFRNLTYENLKYLNVQQALADLAHFIRTIKSSSPALNDSRVILHGKSHGGSLATWFKILYPDLADGVWASGAPLLAKLDCNELTEAIGRRIKIFGGDSCYNCLANGIKKMEQMVAENRSAELRTAFNLCDAFDASNELDVANLFYKIILLIDWNTQSKNGIKDICEKLIHKGLTYFLSPFPNEGCNNYTYKNQVAWHKADTVLYLSCNELGWFPTTNSTQQPFGTKVPLSFFYNYCKDVFGDKFTPEYMESQINKTNQLFGGLNPQVENVFFTYGEFDSSLPLGMQDAKKAVIIPGEIIWEDSAYSTDDTEAMASAKSRFKNLASKWSEQYTA